jgi:RNA polymerase sigma-70 factor (ECF subfamily)
VNETDAELARRAAAGEPAAAEELARTHGPAAFRVARSLGLGEHDAEDLAQEVLVRLLGLLGRYDPERASLRTLVYRMTANAVSDFRSRPAAREARADSELLRSAPDPRGYTEAGRLEAAELRRLILAAAAELPERQRQVFILHDLEELPVGDVAAALETSASNVRVHLCSARRALRERLAHLLEG